MTKGRIHLFNNTVHATLPTALKRVPGGQTIFVNRRIEQHYHQVLAGRAICCINPDVLSTFRPLLHRLQQGLDVYVCLEVDQAAFQRIAQCAYRYQIDIEPIMTPHGMRPGDTIQIRDRAEILPKIQHYLLVSYLTTHRKGEPIHLFNELLESARHYGYDRTICKDISGEATYRQILLNTYVLSQRLRRELRSTERVAVLLPNSIGLLVTVLALLYLNKRPVLLNYSAGVQTIVDACDTATVSYVLTSREFITKGQLETVEEALRARVSLSYMENTRKSISLNDKLQGWMSFKRKKKAALATDNAIILFTSGSEYRPRGVVLSHDNVFANVQQTRSVIDFGVEDRMLNAMPMFHSFGLMGGALLPVLSGIQTYLYPSPLHFKRIPELAHEEKSTILFGTSSFLEKYGQFAQPEDFHTLRYAVVGAERLRVEVETHWLKKFQLQIMQGYGATEASPIISLDTPLNHKQGSVGRFLPGITHQLVPVEGIPEGGKLLVQGPNIMDGYLEYEEGYQKQEGWYDTGDIVTVDDERFVTIVGRLKRFAKITGEMISLNVVEQLAQQCYGSTEFAAMSTQDARRGEKIVLFTTLSGLSLAKMQGVIDNDGYSKLHMPSEIREIAEFPLLGSGKTDYVTLGQWIDNP